MFLIYDFFVDISKIVKFQLKISYTFIFLLTKMDWFYKRIKINEKKIGHNTFMKNTEHSTILNVIIKPGNQISSHF